MSFSTRRGFLQKSSMLAAVAASGMLPRIAQAADAKSPKLGIQLYSLRGYKVDEALKHAADLGFGESTAKNIWVPSVYGTYVITPEHLSGDRPVRFLGVAAENEGFAPAPTSAPEPAQ